MTKTSIEENAISKDDQWRERIAEQERSGLSVKQFCKERGVSEYSFYTWRKRLAKKEPVRFALVDREAAGQEAATALELLLRSGERLRIGSGVDVATLRTVLEALRA
jgi:Transposase